MKKTAKKKWIPNMAGAWVSWVQIGFGQMMWTLYVPNHIAPIGLAWGDGHGKRFELAGCFVEPWARRNGVMTRINQTILSSGQFQSISTVVGSTGKDGGLAFLKDAGYAHNKELDLWHMSRK